MPYQWFFAPLPRRGRISPRPPSPVGKGEIFTLFRRGLPPPAPLRLNPGGTGEGGEPRARRGACPVGCPLSLPLACFSAPYPPNPLPGGKGETKVILCKGLRPLHPRGLTRAALGKGANHAPGGGVPGWLSAVPDDCFLFCPLSPQPPSPVGKGEIFTLFRRGLPPPAPLRLSLYGAGSTFGKQFLSVMPRTFPFNNMIEKSSGGSGGLFQESPSVFPFLSVMPKTFPFNNIIEESP